MRVIYRDVNPVVIINTTTTTEIFRFDFNEHAALNGTPVLSNAQGFRVSTWGWFNENMTGEGLITFTSKVGSSMVAINNVIPYGGYPCWTHKLTCFVQPGLNKVYGVSELYHGQSTGGALGNGSVAVSDLVSPTVDLSSDAVVSITVGLDVAHANFDCTKKMVMLEVF